MKTVLENRDDEQSKDDDSFVKEQAILLFKAAGFKVYPHCKRGKYDLDMIVSGEGTEVCVEIDGDKYHKDIGEFQSSDDELRDDCLNEMGIQVLRFTAKQMQDDSINCLDKLEKVIKRKGLRAV